MNKYIKKRLGFDSIPKTQQQIIKWCSNIGSNGFY